MTTNIKKLQADNANLRRIIRGLRKGTGHVLVNDLKNKNTFLRKELASIRRSKQVETQEKLNV